MNPLLPISILMIVALDAIVGTGPGGMLMNKVHTIERMRTTALLPKIANRLPRVQWEAKGAQDAQVQAMQRVHEILTRDNPATFSADVEARIRAEFGDLVVGDAISIHPTTNSQ
jgi:trimethylamine--corrinoid protein Co-methyltransferase